MDGMDEKDKKKERKWKVVVKFNELIITIFFLGGGGWR